MISPTEHSHIYTLSQYAAFMVGPDAVDGPAITRAGTPPRRDRRLVRIAGRVDDAAAWARMGRELLEPDDHPYARHLHDILLRKLIAGDPDLTLTAADRAEHERRMAS